MLNYAALGNYVVLLDIRFLSQSSLQVLTIWIVTYRAICFSDELIEQSMNTVEQVSTYV